MLHTCQAAPSYSLQEAGDVFVSSQRFPAWGEAGAVVLPPVPGFYTLPTTISEIVDHTITKILDQFHLDLSLIERWSGLNPPGS